MFILYLEDNPFDADLALRRLKQHGGEISLDVASTLQEAIARLDRKTSYDLVLTDLWVPDGTGLDLLAHIRARNLPLPVVVLTGAGDDEAAVGALKAGAVDYVVKQGNYLLRLPEVFKEALARYREQLANQPRPIRVLGAGFRSSETDLLRRHLAIHAPHILLEVGEAISDIQQLAGYDRKSTFLNDDACYDVILLNYQFPDDMTLELVETLRQHHADLSVVILTDRGNEEVAVRVLKQGADYLVKHPGYLYQLPGMLENAFHRSQLVRNQAILQDNLEKLRELFNQPLTGMAFISTDLSMAGGE